MKSKTSDITLGCENPTEHMSEKHGDDPQLIISVHGTGAADEADRGGRWWQNGSPFQLAVASQTASCAEAAKPLHWSGANSELDRRATAILLLKQMHELDLIGKEYHLVGHSHGGSVIWHALVASARSGERLKGLRSWTTVGTPFLKFRPELPSRWRWITFVLLAVICCWLIFYRNDAADWVATTYRIWRNGDWRSLLTASTFFVALISLTTWALQRIVAPIIRYGKDASVTGVAEKTAAQWYKPIWLSLWHPLDEPINGLSGTLGGAPMIAPRIRVDGFVHSIVPLLGPLVNRIFARAADEFAWLQIVRRAQGADLPGHDLIRVGREPVALVPGYAAINASIALKIEQAADLKAADSVGRLRALMETAYDTQSAALLLSRVATVVSFQELIHTSYFDHPEVAEIVATHISTHSKRRAVPSQALALQPPQLLSPTSVRFQRIASRENLEVVVALLVFLVPALFLAAAGSASFDATVAPETVRYQVKRIESRLSIMPAISGQGSTMHEYAKVLVRLAQLGEIKDPISAIEGFNVQQLRSDGGPIVARYLGSIGDWPAVERLLASGRLIRIADTNLTNRAEHEMRLEALIGASENVHSQTRIHPVLDGLLNSIEADARSTLTSAINARELNVFRWAAVGKAFVTFGEHDRVNRLLSLDVPVSSVDRDRALAEARCSLADLLRAAKQINFDRWLQFCDKVWSEHRKIDALLSEASSASPPTAELSTRLRPLFETVELQLHEVIKQYKRLEGATTPMLQDPCAKETTRRREGATTPMLQGNLAGKRVIASLSLLYQAATSLGSDESKKFADAAARFVDIPDEMTRLERLAVLLSLTESIASATGKFPREDVWKNAAVSSAALALKHATFLAENYIHVTKDFDADNIFTLAPKSLAGAGLDQAARQFIRDLNWKLREQPRGSLGALLPLQLAGAAKATKYREFQAQRLAEAIESLQTLSDAHADKENDIAEMAMLAALIAGPELPELARHALIIAERNLEMANIADKWSELLPDMVPLWIALNDLPRARTLAERAPSSTQTMALYSPILEEVIRRRGKKLVDQRITN